MPLPFVSLAAQKHYLNMGKSCLRFQAAEDLALDVVSEAVAKTSVSEYIERYEASRR